MLALGTVLVLLMIHLSQPSSLDNHLENVIAEWHKKMEKMFKDFP